MKQKLVIVDAGNLAYRAHFAHSGLSYHGRPTGILFGFLEMLKSIRSNAGDRIVFCWDYGVPGVDRPGKSWRKQVFPAYKANRKRDKSVQLAFNSQVPRLCQTLAALGYRCVGHPELEADDMAGLIVGASKGAAIVVSGDKDLCQLLAWEGVTILHPAGWKLITAAKVERELGFPVEKFSAYLALGGDTSDNIRPAPRVFGPKTAAKMVLAGVDPAQEGPEDAWLKMFPQLAVWENVRAAYRVAQIPVYWNLLPGFVAPRKQSFNFNDYQRGKPRAQEFLKFCTEYGMKTLIQERRRFL